MWKNSIGIIVLFLTIYAFAAENTATQAAQVLAKAQVTNSIAVPGLNGWIYSKNEFEHLAAGDLAEGEIAGKSKSIKPNNANPINAIADFNKQLNALGIALYVVPVPAKAAIYPENANLDLKPGDAAGYVQAFYRELQQQNINVVDLTQVFVDNRHNVDLYCRTDAHWSPAGINLAAQELAKLVNPQAVPGKNFQLSEQKITVAGDLAKALKAESPATEELTLFQVSGHTASEQSPVLIIGDSHTLIFSIGQDMLAEKGGLPELLAYYLDQPVDVIGIRGSAATQVRINLYRKATKNPDWLLNKKVIFWCFSVREFTESTTGWVKVPIKK